VSARILRGKEVAEAVYADLRGRIAALSGRGVKPGLAALLVGNNPASEIYVRNKVQACESVGLHSEVRRLGEDCTEERLLAEIRSINTDPRLHGLIVQLPLPSHIDAAGAMAAIAVEKDVDGFSWHNLGALVSGVPALVPCTPLGVMAMLDHAQIPIAGRHAVLVGRSTTVGKPMALLLIMRGATVTICNSKTPDLRRHTATADILIAAAGRARLITADMVKPGATVIDVGINRLPDGKIAGDVDFEPVAAVASLLTPVPGGVGPMTVAMLIGNTVRAAEALLTPE